MDLRTYIQERKLNASQIARDIGVSIDYMGRLVRGQHKPSRRLARDISIYTQGEVSAEELLC